MQRLDHDNTAHAAAQPLRLGIIGSLEDQYVAELGRRFPGVNVVPATAEDLGALVVWDQNVDATIRAIQQHPRLPWVHLRWAGVPEPVLDAVRTHPAELTNGSGAHGPAIAEYVAGVVLAHYKGLHVLRAAQTRAEWLADFRMRELRGQLVGVIGLGDLGLSIARALRPFGVELRGLRRTTAPTPEVDRIFAPAALSEFLDGLHVLVVAAPLTPQTHGLIGAAELARLAAGALLVNVGRAAIVDDAALVSALRADGLGGAALDVFMDEPLPPSSPLWAMPNVYISPHCADATPESRERGLALFLDNLGRFVRGEQLRNVVDRQAGY
ncbi:MAG: D-2-hydroxyacid dehydrogenase [Chloroflexota bacterium]|nr:D-2-hydroxyacid dehydrogenase [Chloroflexota bacterium]